MERFIEVEKMEPVIKASEYLTEYAVSHTAIDEIIVTAQQRRSIRSGGK